MFSSIREIDSFITSNEQVLDRLKTQKEECIDAIHITEKIISDAKHEKEELIKKTEMVKFGEKVYIIDLDPKWRFKNIYTLNRFRMGGLTYYNLFSSEGNTWTDCKKFVGFIGNGISITELNEFVSRSSEYKVEKV